MGQELALDVQPAAESGHRPIRPDHPVAGYNDGNRVASIGQAHGPDGPRIVEFAGDVAIAPSGAERDGGKLLPDLFLKRRALGIELEFETGALVGEILAQLRFGSVEMEVFWVIPRQIRLRGAMS